MQALYISSMTHNYEDLLKTKSTTFTLQKKEFKNLLEKLLDKNKTLINELNSVHEKYSKYFSHAKNKSTFGRRKAKNSSKRKQ